MASPLVRPLRFALFLAAFALACEEGEPGRAGWRVGIDTLPSGARLVVNFPPGQRDSSVVWRVEEELRIGGIGPSDPRTFVDVRDLAVDGAGQLYVLDGVTGVVRVFGPSGIYVGGMGEGVIPPLQATGLALAPDGTIWVPDVDAGRMIVLDSLGEVVARHEISFPGSASQWQGGFDREGHLFDVATLPPDSPDKGPTLRRFDSDMKVLETYPLPRGEDRLFHFPRGATRIPFAGELRWLVDPRGFVWLTETDRYRIYKRTWAGDTLLVVESWRAPLPVEEAERDSALEHLNHLMGLVGEAYIDLERIPDTKPVLENIDLDSEGRLWVRVADGRPDTFFEVFDTLGVFVSAAQADFRVPEWRHTIIRDSLMYAVTQDELGVPFVILARIHR